MTINTKEELEELIENGEIIKELSGKHDCNYEVYVTEKNNKFYQFTVEFSYNEGIQFNLPMVGEEVEKVEVITAIWKKVKK